jgi:transcriptional regulator with XRE-family HTH domain
MRAAQARLVLGSRMRELREDAGMSLRRSAQESGWDKAYLSRVERGATRASMLLVEWYDTTFGADRVLVRQFLELNEAVREEHALALRDTRYGSPGKNASRWMAAGGPVPADYDPRDMSLFVCETVPDGSLFGPSQRFDKSWTVRNAGPMHWRQRWLTRQGTAGVPGWLHSPKCVPVPDTGPGAEATIVVAMRTPQWSGACVAYFKITDAAGRPYFPTSRTGPLYCTIYVTD